MGSTERPAHRAEDARDRRGRWSTVPSSQEAMYDHVSAPCSLPCRTRGSRLALPLALAVGLGTTTASAAVGGPDAYGWYTFADQADGTTYGYVDITVTGTSLTLIPDATESVALPTPFFFYGHTLTDIVVNANGFLSSDLWSNFGTNNGCPLPLGAGDLRIYALHDDLNADTYYQYFDEAGAAALGFVGETAGISVFQWVGTHTGGGPVDFEAILFHGDSSIMMMVAVDAEAGAGSTMGIQANSGDAGLHYECNTPGSVVPGATAVRFTLNPDSDCCTASPSGQPGCLNIGCQQTVCAAEPACCISGWDAACELLSQTQCAILCGAPPPPITINEIRIDQPGGDTDEYVELVGPPGTSLDGLQYLTIGGTFTGSMTEVVDLSGGVIPPDGHFVIAEGTFSLGPAPELTTSLDLPNIRIYTHMLVAGLSAIEGTRLDSNTDGVLDFRPWDAVLDTVAVIDATNAQLPYGPTNVLGGASECVAGPTCQQVGDGVGDPVHVYRCPDAGGAWRIGNADPFGIPMTDSPGSPNTCLLCGDGFVEGLEDCDDSGPSATCDADCTPAMCGDGVFNPSAAEQCDDGGETAACDADCTVVSCGDGLVNASAGEQCDDGGESSDCNADCTLAACGDGVHNATAGEQCDDGAQSAICDVDCTLAQCGDMLVNVRAGETCDDGGRSRTCNADCTSTSCGDGIVNVVAGEQCDDGAESPSCDADCTDVECGDGVVNTEAGEECDDANVQDADGCSAECTVEMTDTGTDETSGGTTGPAPQGSSTSAADAQSTGEAGESGQADATDGTGTTRSTDTAGATPSDQGCRCSGREQDHDGLPWLLLGLLGLGIVRSGSPYSISRSM